MSFDPARRTKINVVCKMQNVNENDAICQRVPGGIKTNKNASCLIRVYWNTNKFLNVQHVGNCGRSCDTAVYLGRSQSTHFYVILT